MPMTLLDELDIRILASLQSHARLTNLELAERARQVLNETAKDE